MTSADVLLDRVARRSWRGRGYLVTMGTVLALAGGLGLTVLGLGSADQAVASYDAASWVWSGSQGEMARINGVTARVDTRVDVPRGRGHQVQVSQNDRYVMLRDVNTGAIGAMDPTTLRQSWSASPGGGLGVRVVLHEDAAFVVDAVQGQVQQIDPRSLGPIGPALRFPPGITGGDVDSDGRLWIAAPSEGTVTAIVAAPLPSSAPAGGSGGTAGPRQVHTVSVAPPSQDLTLSTLDHGVAVLNRTASRLTTVGADKSPARETTLPLAGPGTLPPRIAGQSVAVTVPDARRVYVVGEHGLRTQFAVPGSGAGLQPAVSWQGFYYVADADTGSVHVFDGSGTPHRDIAFHRPGGPIELDVREGYLFLNAPGSAVARVVDDQHRVRTVNKYADDVLGGDPPTALPEPPAPPKPKRPTVSQPGPPRNVRAAAGNAQARVSWEAAASHGAAITRYAVSGAGRKFDVGADQRSVTVTGLTNGETYRFTVHAVNRRGAGPDRSSNAVRPTADVPDPPASVSAEAKPAGTVVVSWPAADGQGLEIKRYTVTAISEGGSAPVGDAGGTSLTVPAGQLEYGRQYAFTVVAVNERGAGSQASPVSGSVVPYTRPGRPEGVEAATDGGQAGAVTVAWQPAPDHGRPIRTYVVRGGGKSVEVTDATSATLTGFDTGATVAVEVRAVNEAGEGEPGTASARTVTAPKVTVTGVTTTFHSATVSFSVDKGGASTTACSVAVPGSNPASGDCASLTVNGVAPSTGYPFTVTAQNVAGTTRTTGQTTTAALYGTATCVNGATGDTATYCDADVPGRNGNEIFSVTRQDNSKQVGWARPGTRLQAHCRKAGEEVFAYIYNNDKRSIWWIQVDYRGRNYIPWAWLNFSNDKATLDVLPVC